MKPSLTRNQARLIQFVLLPSMFVRGCINIGITVVELIAMSALLASCCIYCKIAGHLASKPSDGITGRASPPKDQRNFEVRQIASLNLPEGWSIKHIKDGRYRLTHEHTSHVKTFTLGNRSPKQLTEEIYDHIINQYND